MAKTNRRATTKTAGAKARGRPNRAVVLLGRVLLPVGILAGVALGVWYAGVGLHRLLFVRNPNLVLRHIEVHLTGQLRTSEVLARLEEAGIEAGATNLFAIDLGQVRTWLTNCVDIERAFAARQLPDTLEVWVHQRQPAAQLLKPGGMLLDRHGWVLPSRADFDLAQLPVITGIRGARKLEVGGQVRDDMVRGALDFLRILAMESYGRLFDVGMVQLDYSGKALKVYLRKRGTFVDGALLVVPLRGMDPAMRRAEVIANERFRGRQTTSFLDATYEVNVPVRP